ncbi:hypothetical protein [Lutispora sp.]|uniref:hypothetical protein n=1 Tax=Lutispora sp. TaxID=2828727 RepID=UPI002B20385B|nr:hypothetical protein [Lutispora sp.]MEA4961595.1 hypothetical protein [Lutispora sp.]
MPRDIQKEYDGETKLAMEKIMKWYISWYSVDDLRRITRFVSVMHISNSNVELFRT